MDLWSSALSAARRHPLAFRAALVAVLLVLTTAVGFAIADRHHEVKLCPAVLDIDSNGRARAKQVPPHCPLPANWGPVTVTPEGLVVQPSDCPRDPSLPGCAERPDG